MKKVLLPILCIVLIAAAFAGGLFVGKINTDADEQPSTSSNAPAVSAKVENIALSEKNQINVIFSPHTGSDETGDGTLEHPYETMEKAKEHAKTITPGENEEVVLLEFMMAVDVRTYAAKGVSSCTGEGDINMIPFSCSVESYYFTGKSEIDGCDTQKFGVPGSPCFSARYLIKGTDYRGKECSIFIENNGNTLEKCVPTVITDSLALNEWQNTPLRTIVVPGGAGVTVNVFKITKA